MQYHISSTYTVTCKAQRHLGVPPLREESETLAGAAMAARGWCERHNLGASELAGRAWITDGSGRRVAIAAYNGRVLGLDGRLLPEGGVS